MPFIHRTNALDPIGTVGDATEAEVDAAARELLQILPKACLVAGIESLFLLYQLVQQ
nr:hypothetical protein [uncultured Pseudomonas sp.]